MKEEKNVMKTYTLVADNVKAKVKIYREKEDYVSRYEVTYPKIEEATSVILGSIKEELIHSLGIKASEILDPNVIEKVKKEFSLLFLVLTVSLGVSSAMISDSLKSLVFNPLSSSLTCFVKICELLVGVSWLVLLIRIILEAFRIQRRHAPLFLKKQPTIYLKMELHRRSNPAGKVRNNLSFF